MTGVPLGNAEGMEMSSKHSPRSNWRFGLRALLVLIVVIGGWLGWIAHSARVQREAVAAIEKAGGWSAYDWEWRDGSRIPNGKPWGPKWLVDFIGVDHFGSVVAVGLPQVASDAVMVHVGHLSRLEG
jgi:hypothetical protein